MPATTNSRPTYAYRNKRSGPSDRGSLLRKGPSPVKRTATFSATLVPTCCLAVLLPDFDLFQQGALFACTVAAAILTFSLVAVGGNKGRRRRVSLAADSTLGVVFGLLMVGVLAAVQQIPMRINAESILQEPMPIPTMINPEVDEVAEPKSTSDQTPKTTMDSSGTSIEGAAGAALEANRYQVAKPVTKSSEVATSKIAKPQPVPRVLPAGTRIQAVAANQAALSVRVEKSPSVYLAGLASKDFRIASAQGTTLPFRLIENPSRVVSKAASISILVDQSLDRHTDYPVAIKFVDQVMQQVPHADYRAASFGSQVHILTSWTQDRAVIWNGLQRSPHSYGSMLPTAINVNVDDLATRPGERILIIFTDGLRQPVLDATHQVQRALDRHRVHLIVVRSQSGIEDDPNLRKLVRACDGDWYSSSQGSDVQRNIRQRTTANIPAYYSLFFDQGDVQWPLTLEVGSGDSALTQVVPRRR